MPEDTGNFGVDFGKVTYSMCSRCVEDCGKNINGGLFYDAMPFVPSLGPFSK